MTGTDELTSQALRRAGDTIRRLRERLADLEAPRPLAVIGMACRLPGRADTPESFWDLLLSGRDAIGRLPDERWAGRDFTSWDAAATRSGWAGVVSGVEDFDAEFFGIPADEAAVMDPQHRLALELSCDALERAGLPLDELRDSRTGVFLGVGHQDYLLTSLVGGMAGDHRVGAGNARSMTANRISHHLGLRGPSLTVDTACSSSLTAIHLACQSLRAGECDVALAGGVNLILSPLSTTVTGRGLPLAPDGRVKALAADADGMVRAEGCGIVVLRRLPDAVAARDDIAAVVLASACNADGETNGLTAPNPLAQRALLEEALRRGRITPADVTFVELHGTGTPLGDPIEFAAVAAAYGTAEQEPTCWLGSAKATIGHAEASAGVASFVKAVEAVRRATVPPQANLERLNPHIDLAGTRFAVATEPTPWRPGRPRLAGVSSFGFGGSNAHVVLGEAPPVIPTTPADGGPVVLVASARSAAALREQLRRLADLVAGLGPADLTRYAAALARRRAGHRVRAAVVGTDPAAVAEGLRELAAAGHGPGGSLVAAGPGVPEEEVDRARRWCAGEPVDWAAVYPGPVEAVPLPTYPWQRRRHWLPDRAAPARQDREQPPWPGRAAGPGPRVLLALVRRMVAAPLGCDPAALDVVAPATELGLDSMAFMDLKNQVEEELGLVLPVTALLDGASLSEIARRLAALADGERSFPPQAARALLERVDDLSEEQLDLILASTRPPDTGRGPR